MDDKKLKFFELISLALRSFRTKPQRLFLTVMGMAIGIATVLLLVSLGYGLQYILIGKLMTTEDSLITMEISYPSESGLFIKKNTIENLKKYDNVSEVSPVAEFNGEVSEGSISGVLVDTRIVEPSYFRMSGVLPNIGIVPTEQNPGVVIGSQTLLPLGLALKEESLNKNLNFKIIYKNNEDNTQEEVYSNYPLNIRGIISDDSMSPVLIVYSSYLSKEPLFYSKALVKAKDVDVLESLRDKLIGDGFIVSARMDMVTQARKFTNILTIVLGVFGVTALVVSAIGMFNTMIVGFMERIYEVGVLKSIGATDENVRNLFLIESSLMGLMGGVSGIFIGVFGCEFLNILISFLSKRFGGESIRLFMTPWWFILLVLFFSTIIGLISGWWPASRASKLSPKEAFIRK